MSELKRDKVKYVRDKAKSKYQKGTECEICGTSELLEFHHYYSVTGLFNKWLAQHPELEDKYITVWRDDFIAEHQKELYEDTVTLCKGHHARLHSIYGKEPSLGTAGKQERWVGIQRGKHGLV